MGTHQPGIPSESRVADASAAAPADERPAPPPADPESPERLVERLERSEARYRRLVEISPDGIVVDRDGRIVFANPAFLRLAGATRFEDVLGRDTLDFVHPDTRGVASETLIRMLKTGRPEALIEERLLRLDGSVVDVEVAAMPFEDAGTRCVEFVVRDATDRRRREEEGRRVHEELERRVAARTAELATSEAGIREIVETALDAVISTDARGVVTRWNAHAAELFGWSPAEAVGRELVELVVPPHLRALSRATLAKAAAETGTGYRTRFETPAVARSGREFPVEVSLVRGDASTGPTFSAFVRDIEERRRANERARVGERRLRQIIDLVPHFIFAKDEEGRYLLVNQAVANVFGRRVEDVIGRRDVDLGRSEEEARAFRDADQRVLRGGLERVVVEEQVTDRTGAARTVRTVKIPFSFSGTGAPAVLGVATDVTDQKRTEERLRDDERRLRQIIDLVPHFVFAKDTDGRFILVNRAVADAYGTTVEELLGKRDADFARSEEEVARFRADDLEVIRGGRQKLIPEEVITDAQGRQRILQTVKIPFTLSLGGAPAVLGVSIDVTERKRAEERFLQAQKMEGLGRLAGGIAHDFNNLLTAILGYAQLVGGDPSAGPTVRRDVAAIRGAADRASALTRQLLTFARRQRIEARVVDLNDLTLDIDKLLRRVLGAPVELVTVVDEGPRPVEADPGQLEQVLVNLAVNARDAMPSGGRIVLALKDVAADACPAEAEGQTRPGPWVEVSVTDTGVGMTKEVLDHAFEPFFTTKGPGVGTGLGLATCYGIVKQYGGHIWAESRPGEGSTFRLLLPRSAKPATRPHVDEDRPAPRGRETILVVDDDAIVRDVSARALRASGYDVLCAATATEVLAIADAHEGPIHLLLADVVMPGMSGPEVAERLLERRPDTRVLYVSGYHELPSPGTRPFPGGGEVVPKPFTPTALARRVRDVLDRPR